MTELNLPSFDPKLKLEGNDKQIFDPVRRKYFVCTPEEWVRQHVLHYLIHHLNYPMGLLAVEKQLKVEGQLRRPDIVVHNRNGKAVMIVELKAPEVVLDEKVMRQIAMYNNPLKVPFLLLSNGLEHFLLKMDYHKNSIDFEPRLYDYQELMDKS